MKNLISILIVFLSLQGLRAQENTVKKDFLFENPVTKEQIKIETGDKVVIWIKRRDIKTTGTILYLSDSTLTLVLRQEPYHQIVPFRIIAKIAVIAQAKKRYIVRVTLKSGNRLKGELIRTTQDSLSLMSPTNAELIRIGASEIKSIRIHRKGSVGRGVGYGAGTGVFLGAIIGYASYTPPDCPYPWFCLDFGPGFDAIAGAVIGGLGGSLAGALIGSASREFIIEGNQVQYDLFANQFK